MAMVRAALAIVAVAGVEALYEDTTGHTDCQCIDPDIFSSARQSSYSSVCTDPAKPLPVQIQGSTYCYPANYGSSTCKAHDKPLEPECAHGSGVPKSNAPSWCSMSWCYVDARSCKLTKEHSSYVPYLPNLTFSYGACGNPDYFGDWNLALELENTTLRVHLLNEPPFVYPDRPADHQVGQGIMFDFYKTLFKAAGAKYIVKPLMPYNGSSWSACVRDVSMGAIDLCIGTFWETPERRKDVEFVSPFAVDNFYLVTKKVQANQQINVLSVLDPFTYALWILIALTILAVGFVMFCLERRDAGEGHNDFESPDWVPGLAHTAYLSCFGFWSGGPAHTPTTRGGKIVQLGFGVFLMLMISSYTANLASFLVAKQESTGQIKDITSLIKKGGKLCAWGSVVSTLDSRIPGTAQIALPVKDTQEAFQKLDADECLALCNGENENHNFLATSAHCDKMKVADPVMSIMLSQPVSARLSRPMSYWTVDQIGKGEFDRIKRKYALTDECVAVREAEEAAAVENGKMGPSDFIGTFALTYTCIAIALVYRAIRIFLESVYTSKEDKTRVRRMMSTWKKADGPERESKDEEEPALDVEVEEASTAANDGSKLEETVPPDAAAPAPTMMGVRNVV